MKVYALGLLGAMALIGAMLVPAVSVDAKLAANGLTSTLPLPSKLASNGLTSTLPLPSKLASNGLATTKTGLDWSTIGKHALGK